MRVRVGPLPQLREVAAAAARLPAYVVVLADRDDAVVIAHVAGDLRQARRYDVGARPGTHPGPHPDRPPAQYYGERHLTGSEPLGGGEDDGPDYWLGSSPTRFGAGGPGYRDPGAAGGWAGLGRAAPGRDRRAATGPLRSAGRPDKGSGQGVHGLDGTPWAASWMTQALHHPGGHHVSPHPRTAGGPR
jgi:hypothetical protein